MKIKVLFSSNLNSTGQAANGFENHSRILLKSSPALFTKLTLSPSCFVIQTVQIAVVLARFFLSLPPYFFVAWRSVPREEPAFRF